MIGNRRWLWLFAAAPAAGCVATTFGDGEVACGSDGSCPAGLVCAADGRCRSQSSGCASPEVRFPLLAIDQPNGKLMAWTGTQNLTTSLSANDDNDAKVTLASGDISQRLLAQRFGFVIGDGHADESDGLKITGVQVTVNRSRQGADVRDYTLSLLSSAGALTGANKGEVVSWPEVFANASYGGMTDLWMLGKVDVATVRSPNFGVAISATNTSNLAMSTADAYVNYVKIAVYYSCPAPKNVAQ